MNTAATELVNVITGNGTGRSTRTTIVQNNNHFTFNPGQTDTSGNLALTTGSVAYDSTTNYQGALLCVFSSLSKDGADMAQDVSNCLQCLLRILHHLGTIGRW